MRSWSISWEPLQQAVHWWCNKIRATTWKTVCTDVWYWFLIGYRWKNNGNLDTLILHFDSSIPDPMKNVPGLHCRVGALRLGYTMDQWQRAFLAFWEWTIAFRHWQHSWPFWSEQRKQGATPGSHVVSTFDWGVPFFMNHSGNGNLICWKEMALPLLRLDTWA